MVLDFGLRGIARVGLREGEGGQGMSREKERRVEGG